jgi:hypothetical protein
MKINYHKSYLVPVNLEEEEIQQYAKILCYKLGSSPFKYLEVPLYYEKLNRGDIQVKLLIGFLPGKGDFCHILLG